MTDKTLREVLLDVIGPRVAVSTCTKGEMADAILAIPELQEALRDAAQWRHAVSCFKEWGVVPATRKEEG